jgi:hypothetical protein
MVFLCQKLPRAMAVYTDDSRVAVVKLPAKDGSLSVAKSVLLRFICRRKKPEVNESI